VHGRVLGGAHQHPRRHVLGGMGQVLRQDEGAAADGVDDAAGPEKRLQRQVADGGGAIGIVQGRIGMRAHMRRHGDFADIDRALR
jgi:hypothetical protein